MDNLKGMNNDNEKLFNEVNDTIIRAANEVGISTEQAYNFILAFADAKENVERSFRDTDIVINKLNDLKEKYKEELNNLPTWKEESIGTHRFLRGLIQGIEQSIKIIENNVEWMDTNKVD